MKEWIKISLFIGSFSNDCEDVEFSRPSDDDTVNKEF